MEARLESPSSDEFTISRVLCLRRNSTTASVRVCLAQVTAGSGSGAASGCASHRSVMPVPITAAESAMSTMSTTTAPITRFRQRQRRVGESASVRLLLDVSSSTTIPVRCEWPSEAASFGRQYLLACWNLTLWMPSAPNRSAQWGAGDQRSRRRLLGPLSGS